MEHERPLIDLDWDDGAQPEPLGGGGGGGGGFVYNTIFNFDDTNNNNSSSIYNNNNNNNNDNDNNNQQSAAAAATAVTVESRRRLREYEGRGGREGVFRLPERGAVHPGRPPCLEVRPRPLRETQVGCFLRTLVSTPSHLWAASHNSLRFWNYNHLYHHHSDSPAAPPPPFTQSVHGIPPTLCIVSDDSTRCVWTGHRDGTIRCWTWESSSSFHQYFSWQAHRLPVLSLLFTSFGDLWSCSEGGIVKIWPWEAIEKGLSLSNSQDHHMSSLIVQRSYIGLTPSPASPYTLPSDIRHLLSHHSTSKVWTASSFTFALWDARTRELLKVFNIDGQVESRPDNSTLQDFSMELVSGLKKDKAQSTFGFFQRSRNALIGAADAVRRVAAKGNLFDDNQRTEALVATSDGMIWTGCANGTLIQWDGHGNRIQDFQFQYSPILCFCSFGPRLWVGYASGTIHVLDLDGNLLGQWVAHRSPVIKMSAGGGYVFSLANHGGIRGWNVTTPGPMDNILRSQLAARETLYTKIENVKILTGTWNVGQERASQDSLISWLGSAASDVDIIIVGLQEVEMGAGFLALSAAKETVGLEGSSMGQWWLDAIGKILDEGSTFERGGSRQLAGLLISVWVRNNLKAYVGDVDAAAVPCGFGRAIGNKGAVGLRIRVYGRIICFVNCHFAAHLEAVTRRNADFDHVYRTMTFTRPSNVISAAAAGASFAVQMIPGTTATGSNSAQTMPDLSEADMVVIFGDLNYRLDGISFDEARDFISQRCFDWLKEKDQLRAEMEAGNVFQGLREADIEFPPTYKFEKQQPGLGGYDSGEKRIPAWCDRVLYRDSRSTLTSECSLAYPVVSLVTQYESCMDVTDSDHKPVRCKFSVDIARVDESIRRQEFGEIIRTNEYIKLMLEKLGKVPETVVSTNNILLQNQDTSILRITNKCGKNDAFFEIVCVGQSSVRDDCQASEQSSRGSFGFPRWLQVTPAAGIIKPEHIAEVSVHHEQFETVEEFVDGVPQNRWCEDSRDKEVILLIKVRGSFSTNTRNHPIRLRHCLSAKTKKSDSTDDKPSQQIPGSLLHRADHQRLSGSYDVVDDLRKLRGT